jgi:TPR repeat protein
LANFNKAAKLNDPESFDHLGIMFLRGLGVKKDLTQAKRFFTRGARLGDSWSELNLGEMFESGNFTLEASAPSGAKPFGHPAPLPGVNSLVQAPAAGDSNTPSQPNLSKALQLFSNAAARGNRVAAFKAGQMYETGRGVPQDMAKAMNLYRQSAGQQYAPAQLALGRIAELGQGTPVNLTFAYLWYGAAADQGNAEARQRLDSLVRKLTPSQFEEAQGLLAQLQSKMNGN